MTFLRPLACSALLAVVLASPAFAQAPATPAQTPLPPSVSTAGARAPMTPEMTAARRAMRTACATDIASLCADATPTADGAQPGQRGGGARMQCLRGHAAQLSAPCRDSLVAVRDARKGAAS